MYNSFITFKKFACGKTYRNSSFICMILYKMNYCMQSTMNSATAIIFITKILTKRLFLKMCNMNRMFYKFINTLIFCC